MMSQHMEDKKLDDDDDDDDDDGAKFGCE